MLSQADSPRLTTCHAGCGRTVEYRFSPRVFCSDECRLSKRREVYRKAAEVQRRKRGVGPVKGTAARCERCGGEYLRQVAHGRYCDPCKAEVPRDRARRVSAELRASAEGREHRNRIIAGWARRRRDRDPVFVLRGRVNAAITRMVGKKGGRHWEDLLGYSGAQLRDHLERQFLPGMTWANRGQWHIDHIVPVSSFEFTTPDCPGFKAAWALSNLRPLWATENIRKSAKRTHLI